MGEVEALAAIDRAADHATAAFRRAGGFTPPHLSRDDLRQAARLAAVTAMQRNLSADYTPNEQEAYLARCALGGIQDACYRARAAGRALDKAAPPAGDAPEPAHLDTPESWAVVAQACEAIAKMPHPFPLIVRLALTGGSSADIAKALGLSASRVTHLRSELAAKLNRYLT